MDLIARIEELSIPEPNSGCHLWLGRLSKKGYPMLGRATRAHRAVLADKEGYPLPRAVFACHSCDNRACVNRDHLFPGTNQENVTDKCAKGRQGRVHGPRKLKSSRQASNIRRARLRGVTVPQLAKRYGVSERQVERILAGKSWRPRKAAPSPVAASCAPMEASA